MNSSISASHTNNALCFLSALTLCGPSSHPSTDSLDLVPLSFPGCRCYTEPNSVQTISILMLLILCLSFCFFSSSKTTGPPMESAIMTREVVLPLSQRQDLKCEIQLGRSCINHPFYVYTVCSTAIHPITIISHTPKMLSEACTRNL